MFGLPLVFAAALRSFIRWSLAGCLLGSVAGCWKGFREKLCKVLRLAREAMTPGERAAAETRALALIRRHCISQDEVAEGVARIQAREGPRVRPAPTPPPMPLYPTTVIISFGRQGGFTTTTSNTFIWNG